jgi:hypothetical protein
MGNTGTHMVQVGDIVKCLDFPGNHDHFMIGEVLIINEDDCMMTIKTIACYRDGDFVSKFSPTFTTALPGHNMFDTAVPSRVTFAC